MIKLGVNGKSGQWSQSLCLQKIATASCMLTKIKNLKDKTLFQKFQISIFSLYRKCCVLLKFWFNNNNTLSALLVWENTSVPWLFILLPFRFYLGVGTQPFLCQWSTSWSLVGSSRALGKGSLRAALGQF